MLRARLLGALEVELDGTAIDSPASQRPWALFAYLALAPDGVSRAELANRFWPDVLDQSARASLRSALWALRRQLGERLVVEGERVSLKDSDGVWVDVREFERLAGSGEPEAALSLCGGELLDGVEAEWALAARERHRQRVIELLEGLAGAAEGSGDARRAIELTRRQVERDPFDEEAHRLLMRRLADAGDRAGALRAYRALSERLARELGVAPSAQTREVADALRVGEKAEVRSLTSPAAVGLLPLVGRDAELAELEQAWRAAGAGSGVAAVIRGEPGIGKTRLVTELRLRAHAGVGLSASCAALDLGGSAPFSLWAELIRELLPSLPAPPTEAAWPDDLAVLASDLPEHFARSRAPVATVAPDLQRTRLFEAVVAMLGWAARSAPLLLVFEDAHAADGPSLELAAYAARRMSALRVMMVITRRELPRSAEADRLEHALRARGLLACELELGPLTADVVAALARAAGGLSERDVTRVVERAEGNALLAVETARAFGRGREEVAPSLRGMVRATLAPLGAGARELVELAAVAARPVDATELGQLGLDDLQDAATGAVESGILSGTDGTVGFHHALLRDAVYEEISDPRRRGLHRRWADALMASERAGSVPRPAEVARQLRLAGADAEAVPLLARAAAGARAVAALEQAAAYLREGLQIAPERGDLWLELGELEAWRGDRDRAEQAFERGLLLSEREEPVVQARAWLRRARAYHGPICIPRAVLQSAANAIELLDGCGAAAAEERSEALAAWAWSEAVAGSVDEAERLLAELSAFGPPLANDLRVYDVAHARALVLMRRGIFVESYGPSIAAGEAIVRAGRPDLAYGCWANAASAASAAGENERALEFLDRGFAAITSHGLQGLEVHLLAARAYVLSRLGRLGEAGGACEEERVLAERLGQPELIAMASHDRGMVALLEGDFAAACELLAGSLVEGAPISRPMTRLALAEALARTGRVDRAAEELRETVLEPVGPADFPDALVPRLARVQGLIASARGDELEAARRLEEAIAGWERLLQRAVRAETITTVLADLGRPVVGLIEPERELARARADLKAVQLASVEGRANAVVP